MSLARMRTIEQAIAQLKRDDPGSCLTSHALRVMVLTGAVPHVRAGNKYLINYDGLLAVLAGDMPVQNASASGTIRPVAL